MTWRLLRTRAVCAGRIAERKQREIGRGACRKAARGSLRFVSEKGRSERTDALRPRGCFSPRRSDLDMGTELSRRRRAGQGYGFHDGAATSPGCAHGPSLRGRLSRQAVPGSAFRLRLAGRVPARYGCRAVDGISCRRDPGSGTIEEPGFNGLVLLV